MPGSTFLVIEMPGLHQTFTEFTARHPGCTMDVVLAPLHPGTPDVAVQACMLIRGAPAGTLDALLHEARQRYAQVRTHLRDEAAGTWLGMFQVPRSSLTDPRALAIFGFLQRHDLGLRWVRIEEGVCYARCEVDPAQATALAERCRGYLEGLDLDAEVAVEAAAPRDLGLWQELAELASRTVH
ncbi:MAG: hypothetical protein QOI63_732 [Thermoplasmata archaeon]|jgi:hypothetical protein|nr:hypothetical protein [Thermoplasmata archaeon]